MDPESPTIAHPDGAVLTYRQLAAAGGLLTVALAVGGLVWGWAAQAGQIEVNAGAIDRLSCLPEQVARIEATQEAQGRQLDRIEDATATVRHEDHR
jgi:hypothetical protein